MATGQLGQIIDLLRKVDFSRIKRDTKGKDLSLWSGLKYVNDIVKEVLENNSNQYFFEFSVLSSTINPNTSELYSFSAIQIDENAPGAKTFADNVSKKVGGIINGLYPTIDESQTSAEKKIERLSRNWFHNPEMFLYPTIDEVVPFHVKDSEQSIINVDGSNNVGLFEQLDNGNGCYVANMSYERSLFEMLNAAKTIVLNVKGANNIQDKLIQDYHEGAKALKYAYDQNFRVTGEEYGYVTFPIISSNDKYLTESYTSILFDTKITDPDYKKYFEKSHACGLGHFFLYYKKGNDYLSDDVIDSLFLKINQTLGLMAINYVYSTGLALSDKARKEAIKSAKAAIMSRNLSHNLGSHVMSYLKQNFNSVQEIIANGTLETVIEKDDKQGVGNNNELPLLVGMGKFISYLQERQDYIATVSTDYIPCQSVVNFKDAIYDELNPDYRFYRHKDNWTGHKPANILLQNIAKSEGLSRELLPKDNEEMQTKNNIIIQFRSFNGIDSVSKEDRVAFEDLRKYNFSLPGGIMGRQAVFSIVENVIRNAAKHGSRQEGENLKLTFDIYDAGYEYDKEYSTAIDRQDLYVVTLTDNVKTKEETINDINEVIKKSFYDEGTDLTASNKGIKEMIISAAWLRGIRIEEQNGEEIMAPILKARKSKEGYLQYVFCLPKVKKVAYLTNNQKTLEKNTSELNGFGWYIFALDEYKNLSNRSFEFILLDKSLSMNYEEIRQCSNNRLFQVADSTNYKNRQIKFNIEEVLERFDSKVEGEEKGECLREVEQELFKQMAISSDNETIRIAISDANLEKIVSDKVQQYKKESAISGERYLYRTHNDSTTAFLGFLNSFRKDGKDLIEALNGLEFVEGITGGNSTDRIVRRETKDDLWVYQQIHAMKTKVAVFDERIFTRITGFETSMLQEEKPNLINWKEIFQGKELLDIKNYLNNYDYARNRRITDLNDFFANWSEEKVVRFAQDNYPSEDASGLTLKTILPLVYHKKGIDVFTMTKINEESNCFAIWAVRNNFGNLITNTEDNDYKNNTYGYVEKIAELYFDEPQVPKIRFLKGETIGKKFKCYDYVTIHQGLLDKVYQKMPVRDSKNESDKKKNIGLAKRAVTKVIFDDFIYEEYGKDDYLPGLTIHSGRSKPNKKDMPQNQPFIQYSAVENAVLDCKYTLVELLDFASYE